MIRITVALVICLPAAQDAAPPQESITRDEIIEHCLASVALDRTWPGADVAVSAVDPARVRSDLRNVAKDIEFLPDVIDGLPPGTRERLFRRTLTLLIGDPDYCRDAFRYHVLDFARTAEYARLRPELSRADQKRFLSSVDRLLDAACESLSAVVGNVLTRDEILDLRWRTRSLIEERMRDPTSESGKQLVSDEEIDQIARNFNARLRSSQGRIAELLRRHFDGNSSPSVGSRESLVNSLYHETLYFVLANEVAKASSPDVSSIYAELDKRYPLYRELGARVDEIESRVLRHAAMKRQELFQAQVERDWELEKREVSLLQRAENGDAQAAVELAELRQTQAAERSRRSVRSALLPSSRPSTRPANATPSTTRRAAEPSAR